MSAGKENGLAAGVAAAPAPSSSSSSTSSASSSSSVGMQGEEFQRYLEKSGVIDALTKVLVGLYEAPEKPGNAIDYVKEYLGASVSPASASLASVVEAQQKLLSEKDVEIAALKRQLEQERDRLQLLTAAAAGADSNAEQQQSQQPAAPAAAAASAVSS